MGPELTNPGWHFHDRSRTTAEIISDLYQALRRGAGNSLLLGCNTIGHLGAGLFEVQRIGDDTSGREWSRTRKMGVNTLAFRMPQHNTFFAADADCVPVTKDIPWKLTKQWLDLVALSGTALFVSADPAATGPEQREALKAAFAQASRPLPPGEPLDWMETTTPRALALQRRADRISAGTKTTSVGAPSDFCAETSQYRLCPLRRLQLLHRGDFFGVHSLPHQQAAQDCVAAVLDRRDRLRPVAHALEESLERQVAAVRLAADRHLEVLLLFRALLEHPLVFAVVDDARVEVDAALRADQARVLVVEAVRHHPAMDDVDDAAVGELDHARVVVVDIAIGLHLPDVVHAIDEDLAILEPARRSESGGAHRRH